jgi:hypothetical protein
MRRESQRKSLADFERQKNLTVFTAEVSEKFRSKGTKKIYWLVKRRSRQYIASHKLQQQKNFATSAPSWLFPLRLRVYLIMLT